MTGPMPLATSSLRTTIQRTSDDAGEEDGDEGEGAPVQRSMAVPAVAHTPSLPSLPVLTVSRSAARESGGTSHSTSGASGLAAVAAGSTAVGSSAASMQPAGTTAIQRSAAATPTIRPIAAHNPLRPAIAIQRDADEDAGGDDDDADGALPSPWWAPAAEPGSARSMPSAAGADAGPAVQRSAFAATSPSSPAPAMTTALRSAASAPTWTSPGVQRSARSSGPAPSVRMPLAVPATPAAPASSAAAPAGAPTWAPGTSVSFPQRAITGDPVVQTSRSGIAPGQATSSPVVQREGGTTSTATTTTSAAAPAKEAGHSERELDDLARQLFSRIRTRLRADLLQDREAAGFTFDNV